MGDELYEYGMPAEIMLKETDIEKTETCKKRKNK